MKYYLFWLLAFIACAIVSWQLSQPACLVATTFCAGYCFARLLWKKRDEFYKTQNNYWFKRYQESQDQIDILVDGIHSTVKKNQNESL